MLLRTKIKMTLPSSSSETGKYCMKGLVRRTKHGEPSSESLSMYFSIKPAYLLYFACTTIPSEFMNIENYLRFKNIFLEMVSVRKTAA